MAARATVKPKKQQPKPIPVEDQIRQRAYQIYLDRGDQEGTALDDWLQAETEITHTVEQEFVNPEEIQDTK